MIAVVLAIVVCSILAGFAIGRLMGLSSRLSILIACGNSICGNSAIVAVAPVIDARREEVAAALAFTAVLGIAIVLGLPLAQAWLGLSLPQYGAMAGLTVYAVPQVLAAAAPGGLAAIQAGTLVKLLRVLMLGPVILTLGFLQRRRGGRMVARPVGLLPWFIVGFVVLAAIRSLGLIPDSVLGIPPMLASGLTVVAMAGLGLSVDIGAVAAAGGRVIVAASLSLVVLLAGKLSGDPGPAGACLRLIRSACVPEAFWPGSRHRYPTARDLSRHTPRAQDGAFAHVDAGPTKASAAIQALGPTVIGLGCNWKCGSSTSCVPPQRWARCETIA